MSLREFKEYIKEGIVRQMYPDKNKANSLAENSEKRDIFLKQIVNTIEITDNNANFIIESIYDILIELIRAKMLLDGYSASGNYAHEAEVSYLNELKFPDYEINMMNELRQFRNGVKYYGKSYIKEEAEKFIMFLSSFFPKLKKLIENVKI
ncbi:hypothetical protein HYW76_00345 [Candidatus Pacearchaeota archaeon]|nr:hypothetical protein [Candidatus Pacearchaeota archaeon]